MSGSVVTTVIPEKRGGVLGAGPAVTWVPGLASLAAGHRDFLAALLSRFQNRRVAGEPATVHGQRDAHGEGRAVRQPYGHPAGTRCQQVFVVRTLDFHGQREGGAGIVFQGQRREGGEADEHPLWKCCQLVVSEVQSLQAGKIVEKARRQFGELVFQQIQDPQPRKRDERLGGQLRELVDRQRQEIQL